MADVQLEHGHVRIANRLYEAVLHADFREAQLRIVLALIRITYGWRQRSVMLESEAELARYARLTAGAGGFRRALHELIAEGVVRRHLGGVFEVQKDFGCWGIYSIAEAQLEARFGERPEPGPAPVQSAPTRAHETLDDAPRRAVEAPRRALEAPRRAHDGHATVDAATGSTLERQERQERHTTTTTRGESALTDASTETGADPATVLAVAANRGITERYGEQPAPLRASAGTSLRAVEEISHAGVPIDFARDAIYTAAKRITLDRPPVSLRYFVRGTIEAWQDEQQSRTSAALPAPRERARKGPDSGTDPDPWKQAAAELEAEDLEKKRRKNA